MQVVYVSEGTYCTFIVTQCSALNIINLSTQHKGPLDNCLLIVSLREHASKHVRLKIH